MLSMSAMSSGQASYYLSLAREDYYLAGGEPPGRWFGTGAAQLGLAGQVEPHQLYNLFAGRSPAGDRCLVQSQSHDGKAEHRPGWDLTFSAPKSVSTLWSQAPEATRQKIQEVHARAVRSALQFLEDTATSTRRGKGGRSLEKVGLIVSTFEHSTSRALDPQLHTHALVMNLSLREDRTTGTLSSLDLFLSKMAAGALYRAELSNGLRKELGLAIRRERSWFELVGVSDELVKSFSKRRDAIEEALKRAGLSSAEAAAVAAIQTRDSKEGVSRSRLFEEWRTVGERVGWSTDQATDLFDAALDELSSVEELEAASVRATARLTTDEAFFSERDFVRYLAEESQGRGIGAGEVRERAATHLASSPEIVRLGEHRGEERFTTKAMLDLESSLLAEAAELVQRDDYRLHAEAVMETLSRREDMSEEQMRALWRLTVDSGGLAVVSGMAGTGKTRMLDVARECWEKQGYRVLGAAVAARAGKELSNGAGIESATLARTLFELDEGRSSIGVKTVLVVDEAGMVATPEMQRLVRHCGERGAKLVLVGDERQLQPIGPGAPFMEIGARFGSAVLTEIRRQSEDWARDAVAQLAAGRATTALSAFAQRGLLTVSETRAQSMLDLVVQWRKDGAPPENTLILAATRQESRTLNKLAQEERLRAHELGPEYGEVEGQRIYAGDRVIFTRNGRGLGVENGARGTVDAVLSGGELLKVRLDSGHAVTVRPESFPHVELGYASTTHKAQGATTLRAYVLGGGAMQGRELSYVQASRARTETRIFATASETGDDVAKLAREMARSRQKAMAHSVLRENAQSDHDIAVI